MHRTPVAGSGDTRDLPFVHGLDEELEIFERCRRQHSVPEVEDVTRPPGGATEHLARTVADQVGRPKQHSRIQVALDAAIVPDSVPAGVQWYPPVEGHDVWARRRDGLEHCRRVGGEVEAAGI